MWQWLDSKLKRKNTHNKALHCRRWAEYPRQSKKRSMPDGPEKQKLVEADRAGYEEWLNT